MKKKGWLLLMLFVLFLTSCSKNKEIETVSSSDANIEDKQVNTEKKSDIINNMVIGNSKISFNNDSFDKMSDGKFTQNELWGTFENKDEKHLSVQIDAFDNTQPMYGAIEGYEIEGIKWSTEEPVQYLMVMEEAIQYSEDGKTLMYKARTGDILFSVTMFSEKKLTDEEILTLKSLAKGIQVEFAEGKVDAN